ncbi:hypothetical protein GCM10022243_13660 [Saccharothrix violaceirubra]|uniref:MinD-like ATPase involved in chromosome partitioning or flagellar assembly n=1 Tax=Saccharothrix violaceirubra TaxID=413306 RepID=A0A7W7WTU9_9PSEU|nr:hypothetical protein [Saccharothrix violaceirubra]MBB4963514.1 hypothetical protein [Saccharothrix violaceirubra]
MNGRAVPLPPGAVSLRKVVTSPPVAGRVRLDKAPVARTSLRGRVIAVIGLAGSGRSTVAAQTAAAFAGQGLDEVVSVDASPWPGSSRSPVDPGRAWGWRRLAALPDGSGPTCVPVVHGVWRLGGCEAFDTVGPSEVLRVLDMCRERMAIVDCPAGGAATARACVAVADAVVAVCRADPVDLRNMARLLGLLAGDARRDLPAVVAVVAHRPGRWPRAAAVAEAGVAEVAGAVVRMPFRRELSRTGTVVGPALAGVDVAAAVSLLLG